MQKHVSALVPAAAAKLSDELPPEEKALSGAPLDPLP
jgi:hypothetical protein